MLYLWGRGEAYLMGLRGKFREIDHLKKLSLHRRVILKWISKKRVGCACKGLISLRTETRARLLFLRSFTRRIPLYGFICVLFSV